MRILHIMIARGAEASIERTKDGIKKIREQKTYRHPDLDLSLRTSRTKREAKVLSHLTGLVPELLKTEETTLEMEYIDAPTVRKALTKENMQVIGTQIGKHVKQMHERGVVHGDLTTSNMLYATDSIVLIDFGLAQFSETLEDRAVDLHLLKQGLLTTHPHLDVWDAVVEGYEPEEALLERLTAVEKRGRNKQKV